MDPARTASNNSPTFLFEDALDAASELCRGRQYWPLVAQVEKFFSTNDGDASLTDEAVAAVELIAADWQHLTDADQNRLQKLKVFVKIGGSRITDERFQLLWIRAVGALSRLPAHDKEHLWAEEAAVRAHVGDDWDIVLTDNQR